MDKKEWSKQYYLKHKKKYHDYYKQRIKNPDFKKRMLEKTRDWNKNSKDRKKELMNKWYIENKDYNKKYHLKHKKNKTFKKNHKINQIKYSNKYPEKIKAQQCAQYIKNVNICEICGSMKKIEKHHPSYNEPLNIIPICMTCHKTLHKLLKTEELRL